MATAIFVDRLTKMVHFAPCTKEATASDYAQLFVDHIFRLHGLPDIIVLDRDPHFTHKLWHSLFDLLGTDLWFSTAFHPQMDGQSERTISIFENFMRPYVECHPTKWSSSYCWLNLLSIMPSMFLVNILLLFEFR